LAILNYNQVQDANFLTAFHSKTTKETATQREANDTRKETATQREANDNLCFIWVKIITS